MASLLRVMRFVSLHHGVESGLSQFLHPLLDHLLELNQSLLYRLSWASHVVDDHAHIPLVLLLSLCGQLTLF